MAYNASNELLQLRRVNLLGLIFVVFLVLVMGRIFQRQIIEHSNFLALAKEQHIVNEEMAAKRGKILVYDQQLETYYPLATNVSLYNLSVVPTQIKQPELVVSKLLPFLDDMTETDLLEILKSNKVYVSPLKRRIEVKEKEAIEALTLEGVYLRSEEYRYYPEDDLASNTLGFVNRDRQGQYGIEGYFDQELSGQSGLAQVEKSSLGTHITTGSRKVINPENGADVVLTIDRAVQYFVEKKLQEYVERYEAVGGEVIIMEPQTGKIVAMANYPDFNPNYYNEFSLENFTNPNISSVYEPGSVFKIFTIAAGIDAGLISPNTTYTDTGEIQITDKIIRNSDLAAHGVQTMTQVLEKSLNTGAVFVVQKLGRQLFYKYLKDLGFDAITNVGLAGEVPASMRPFREWPEMDLATMSFGQAIAVTPIQLVAAVGAIANQGKLMKPQIVEKIIYPDGAVAFDPQIVRVVFKPQTAQLVSAMMVNVVEKGHGTQAGVVGYRVAGKTGTAQIAGPGGYEKDDTIGSFVGFAPMDNPRFVMLTRIDRPKGTVFAESSAAPLFGDIAEYLLNYWQVPPER
ncbi:penicillin-binding protein 2 [Patescibacteria group bacterium]|nr:penicillin-binding protein 2 [Patescibacteria group bacterium]